MFSVSPLNLKSQHISYMMPNDHSSQSAVFLGFRMGRGTRIRHVHSASLPSFSIVPVMPRPISAALLANSDRAPFLALLTSPLGDPLAARLCESVSKDCL